MTQYTATINGTEWQWAQLETKVLCAYRDHEGKWQYMPTLQGDAEIMGRTFCEFAEANGKTVNR